MSSGERDGMGAGAGLELPEPPHSPEAEQAVLGALLLDGACFDRVGDLLSPGDFHDATHRTIFASIAKQVLACKSVDPVSVFEDCGVELQYLTRLTMSVLSSAHARRHAEIVRELSIERALQRIGADMAATAGAPGRTVAEKIDAAMARLTRLGENHASRESVPLDEAVVAFIDRLEQEASGNSRVIQTGLRALDRMLAGGLRAGELMVIGARPKMGKTALVLTLARNMAARYGVLVLSQEMPVHELVARNTAALGTLNLADLRRPDEMKAEGWTRVTEAVERMRDLSMVLDDQRALTLADVRRKVMDAKRRHGVDVVVIDFLQLMAGEGDNRNQELDRISNGLKAMAGEFNVAVILLSQLSREADKRHGPPVMTDLRDSGAIEAAADIIALLYREFAHPLGQHTEDWRNHAQLEIVQRNGAPGTISLSFSGEYQQFGDWEGGTPFRKASSRGSARSSGGYE